MVSMFVITSMIYFSNYEFMWLFIVGLSALSVSLLIGIRHLVVKNITVDNRESYKVLKKLEKEGVF